MDEQKRLRLRLPPDASDKLVADVEAEMVKLTEAGATKAIKAREDAIEIQGGVASPPIIQKGDFKMSEKYGYNAYPYLEAEDRAFAQCFRLSEDEFLAMAGGLKRYTQFRLDRDKARGASIEAGGQTKTFSVPSLPSNIEAAMAMILVEGLREDQFASYLLSEQVKKAGGIISALKADKEIKAQMAREAKDKEAGKEHELKALRDEGSNKFLVGSDSQTARDYAERQYELRHRRG